MTKSASNWDIRPEGRSWVIENELLARNEMIPVGARLEFHDGKLLFTDKDRLVLLAMLFENLGLDAVIKAMPSLHDALTKGAVIGRKVLPDLGVESDASPESNNNHASQENVELELSAGQRQKINKSIADYENPVRYVIYYRVTDAWRHYLNVEDGCYCSDVDNATAFKELSMARAIVDLNNGPASHIAQISIDGDTITILADNCLLPVKKSFAQTLADMPKVGVDSDFERDSRRNILCIKGENAFLRLILLAGGVMSAPEASDLLGIEAREIRDLREQGKLIALVFDGDDADYYPFFQFSCRRNEVGTVVSNFPETLALLASESPIDSVVFFLTPDIDLDWDTPINVLKRGENIAMVKRLAKQFGRQVAR